MPEFMAIWPKVSVGSKCAFEKRIVETVLRNIITNAIKFAPNGSVVYVHAEQKSDDLIQIDVIDKGRGFTDDQIDAVFSLNRLGVDTKRAAEGFGVGLKICIKLLKKINAELKIFTEPGVQNTVSIVFPFENRAGKVVSSEDGLDKISIG